MRHRIESLGDHRYRLRLRLDLPVATRLTVQISTLFGLPLRQLGGRRFPTGVHYLPFDLQELRGQVVPVAYAIEAGGRPYTGKFLAVR